MGCGNRETEGEESDPKNIRSNRITNADEKKKQDTILFFFGIKNFDNRNHDFQSRDISIIMIFKIAISGMTSEISRDIGEKSRDHIGIFPSKVDKSKIKIELTENF